MKKLVFLVVLVISLTLLGVGGIAEEKPVTIRIGWWGDTARHERYNKIMDAFQEKYPWITVEREPSTWSDYWDRLATQVAGGNAPDVMGMHQQHAANYANRGALLDLKPYIESNVIRVDKIPQSVLDGCYVNDKLCMLPMGLTVQTQMINKTMLDELGLEVPESWTWKEFADFAKEFRARAVEKGKDWYFTGDSTGVPMFMYMARSNGGDLYTQEGTFGFTVDDLTEWYAFWDDLRKADAVPDASEIIDSAAQTLELNLFSTQKIACSNIPVNQLWLYFKQLPENQIIAGSMPLGNDGKSGAYMEGAHWAASSTIDEEHQKAAVLLIDFLQNEEKAWDYMLMDQGVPANTEMAEYIRPLLEEPQRIAIDFVGKVSEQITHGFEYPPIGSTEIQGLFRTYQEYTMYGTMTPREAAEAFMEEGEAALASYR